MFPTTGRGFTKSRVEQYRTPLALDLSLLPAHVDKVLRFTYLQPAITQTARLVNDKAFRTAMAKLDPTIVPNTLVPWLQRTAKQTVDTPATTAAGRLLGSAMRAIRRNVGISTMFLNLVNAAQQVTGIPAALVKVRGRYLRAALVRFVRGDVVSMRDEVRTLSALMRERMDNGAREALTRIEEAIVQPTTLGEVQAFAMKHGYFLQQGVQNLVDVIVWHGAYDQAIAAGMDPEAAVFEADAVIRQTMGDFSPENVSLFETGSPFVRLFTMFYSFFNAQANTLGTSMQTVIRTMGWSGAPKLFFIYLYGLAIPAIVGEAISQAARGELLDDEDEDGQLDDMLGLLLGSQAKYMTAMVPIVGSLSQAVVGGFTGAFYDDRLNPSPVIAAFEKSAMFFGEAYKLATGEQENPRPMVRNGLTLLSLLTGIPTGQLAKTGGFAVDVATGKQEPEGPADYVTGVISGKGDGGK
jgi:hypothetical protein